MYKLKKSLQVLNNIEYVRWQICSPYIPEFLLCKFLDIKGKNSINTQKTYAMVLVQWLNYLGDKNYSQISFDDLKKYLYKLIFFDKQNRYVLTPSITYKTIKMKQYIILEFYRFLSYEKDINSYLYINNKAFKFFLPIDELEQKSNNAITIFMTRYKSSRKENYKLLYDETEITAIVNNFKLLRDKVIFMLSLYGFRIDEILSIKMNEFDDMNNIIKPSRSKTSKRSIVISEKLTKMIVNYIQFERIGAVVYSGVDSIYLFININKSKHCGKALKYQTFYYSLKRAGVKAGFSTNEIRTHSGRSTKTMQLISSGESDEFIRHYMGWKNPLSINSYVDANNKLLVHKGIKFITKLNNIGS